MKNYWMFVITGMLLIVTTTGFGRMAYGVILPFMQEGMYFTTAQSGYLGTILFLGYLLTVGISGVLTNRRFVSVLYKKQPGSKQKETIDEKIITTWRNKQLYIIAGIYFLVGLVYLIP